MHSNVIDRVEHFFVALSSLTAAQRNALLAQTELKYIESNAKFEPKGMSQNWTFTLPALFQALGQTQLSIIAQPMPAMSLRQFIKLLYASNLQQRLKTQQLSVVVAHSTGKIVTNVYQLQQIAI